MASFMLIDGNSVGYANQHSHVLTAQGMEVQAISGTMRTLAKRLRERPNHFPVVLWDGRANWRYNLYPDYKSSRKKSETSRAARAAYEKQQPYLRIMISKLGLTQVIAEHAEADDIGYQLMKALIAMGHEVLFLTSDTDWLQGMREGMSWLDPKTEKLIASFDDLERFFGTADPRAYIEAKALEGDSADTIDGVPRIGIKTALKVFAQYGGYMTDFYAAVEAGKVDLSKKTLCSLASEEGRITFERNMQLMDLARAPILTCDDIVVTNEPVDEVVFSDWAEHFEFEGILKSLKTFILPFQQVATRPGYMELQHVVTNLGR